MAKKLGANSIKVRQINRNLILEALMDTDGANISELASATGLSIATCANILPDLVESGEALELVARESSGGRPARRFAFNPNHTLIALFMLQHNLGQPEVVYAVTNAAGKTVSTGEKSIPDLKMEHLDALFAQVKKDFAVKAVAVAVPGVVADGTILICDLPGLIGVSLERHIRDTHHIETVIDNDMNFAAVGYHKTNTGISPAGLSFLCFPREHCPGAGLVVNGMLVRGKTNFAGEIHTIAPFLASPGKNRKQRSASPPDAAFMGRIAAVVAAVVNPDVVVISGEAVRPDMADDILETCRAIVPEPHTPRLVIQPSYEKECFLGMQVMALNRLSPDYKLIEKDAAWC